MSSQQQVLIHGPGDVRIDPVPVPEPGPRDAVVRVACCGICGSDVGYAALGGVAGPTGRPMPIGHELAGVVEAVGREVRDVAPGARVVVDPMGSGNRIGNGGPEGGFTPRLLVRDAASGSCLIPIPESLSFEQAALAEPLGVGMHAVDLLALRPGEKVVIFGAGPIGLCALATLCYRGVEDVVVVEPSARRRAIASELGARASLDPEAGSVWTRLRELHGTSPVMGAPMAGTDAYIEASGVASVIGQVLAHAKSRARLAVVGLHREAVPVSFLLVMMKQLAIVGSMAQPDDWQDMLEMLTRVDLSPLVTHRYRLAAFAQGLAVARDATAGAKVMIEIAP